MFDGRLRKAQQGRVLGLAVEHVASQSRVDVGEEGRDDAVTEGKYEVAAVNGEVRFERYVPVGVYLKKKCNELSKNILNKNGRATTK